MHRKLRGSQGYMPRLRPQKSGWGRSNLIDQVRKSSMGMLSELGEEDELQEPLAKAMAIGTLSAKRIQGCSFVVEFWQYSPEIKALQNEIAKAIWFLKEKVRFPELKNLQLLVNPNAELSNRSLRTALKNLLIEFLFECSDMDNIPDYLLETISIVNSYRTSRITPYIFFSKEEIQEEVECILRVSAHIKQVLWDLLPECEFDEDFADAYMKDLEESDDGDDQQEVLFPHNNLFLHDPHDKMETIGETNPANSDSSSSPIGEDDYSPVLTPDRKLNSDCFMRVELEQVTEMDLVDSEAPTSSSSCYEFDGLENMGGNQFHIGSVRYLELNNPDLLALKISRTGSSSHSSPHGRLNRDHVERQEPTVDPEKPPDFVSSHFSEVRNIMHDKTSMSRNQYIAVQEACDKTSMVAYRLIGCVLDEFAQIDGLNLERDAVSYLRGDNSIRKDSRDLLSMLDDMTNRGLQLLAEILTGGLIKFEKTRWKMKKIIRESLPEALERGKDNYKINLAEQLRKLVRNPLNFLRNGATLPIPASLSYCVAATRILDGLEDMSFQTLSAMHRKLRGSQGYMPRLRPQKSRWGRSNLIDQVRKSSMGMLSELGEEDELQEPLAKAMAIGTLSAKRIQGCSFVVEFWQYSPEIEALQNEIAKAIWFLKEKVRFPELKNLQLLVDPNAELSNRSLRTALKNLLIEFLFECSDMDSIPDYLLETISVVNNAYMEDLEESDDGDDQQEVLFPHNNMFLHDPHDKMETIGETNPANSDSSASPIGEDDYSPVLTPDRKLNSDCFMRVELKQVTEMDLVDSDAPTSSSSCYEFDGLENMGGNQFHIGSVRYLELNNPDLLALKISRIGFSSHSSSYERLNRDHVERQEPTVDPEKPPDFVSSHFSEVRNIMHDKTSMCRNQYIVVQEAYDKTSMVAYPLIGCVLDEFAQIDGLNLERDAVSYLRGDNSHRKDSKVAAVGSLLHCRCRHRFSFFTAVALLASLFFLHYHRSTVDATFPSPLSSPPIFLPCHH
ncbi:hypothetical protein U1Q18_020382 [Sarracenia purpurea var. burkii]